LGDQIKNNEMGEECSGNETDECLKKFWSENLEERSHLDDPGTNVRKY